MTMNPSRALQDLIFMGYAALTYSEVPLLTFFGPVLDRDDRLLGQVENGISEPGSLPFGPQRWLSHSLGGRND